MFRRGGFHAYRESYVRKAARKYSIPVTIILISTVICHLFFLRSFIVLDQSMSPGIQPGDILLVSLQVKTYNHGDLTLYYPPYTRQHTVFTLIRRALSYLPGSLLPEYPNYLHRPVIREILHNDHSETDISQVFFENVPEGFPLHASDFSSMEENQVLLLAHSGSGHIDSRHTGAVNTNDLTGRAFFRIWPLHRFGRLTPGNAL
ncbi:S26 family signal peptidase [Spirochaeta dissipatitropha]